MIENGFVYAVNKSLEKNARKEEKQQTKTDKFYAICHKYNKTVNELNKEELTKAEYKIIVEYIEKVCKYPLKYYPNLQ
jgi:hypothetical protein